MKRSHSGSPNLLDSVQPRSTFQNGAPWWGKVLFVLLAGVVSGGVYFTVSLTTRVGKAFSAVTANTNEGFLSQLRQLTNPPEKLLQGEAADRINIVILGVGGEGHAGSQLTDTIIVASYQPSAERPALFSIPRDLVVNIPGYGYRKINTANAFAEEAGPRGNGAVVTSGVISQLLDAPMHYYVRVDFDGFEKLIDDIGGIDVDVDTSFTDREYPTENYGYQTISFTAGRNHFDGATALKYVRSRHGNNGEGSDFARSRRQQKILIALKNKVFSLGTLLNPTRITNTITTLGQHIVTNFAPWELMKLVSIGKKLDVNTITTKVLDTSPEGLLVNTTGIDGAYLLEPRVGNYSEIRAAFANLFTQTQEQQATTAQIEIRNGTTGAGLGARTAASLESTEFHVANVRNAEKRSYTKTIIYDLTGGKKTALLAALKTKLHAEVVAALPTVLSTNGSALNISDVGPSLTNADVLQELQTNPSLATIDFVVILGTDQLTTQ